MEMNTICWQCGKKAPVNESGICEKCWEKYEHLRKTKKALRVYFAHSRLDYGSKREGDMLERIKHTFISYEVINPGEPMFVKKMVALAGPTEIQIEHIKPWLKVIESCSGLVFMPLETGKTGIGTYLEVKYAETRKIPVYVWDGTEFTTKYSLNVLEQNYNDNWGVVRL